MENKEGSTMKKQRIMWACLTLILTTSFCACSYEKGNTYTNGSRTPITSAVPTEPVTQTAGSDAGKEANLPQVEKTEMLSGFLPLKLGFRRFPVGIW